MPTVTFRACAACRESLSFSHGLLRIYATDILETAPPPRTDPVRARQHSLCGQKPLRGPIHNAISGYRYNNPELGRWINRDPIGEAGGSNLYVFVGNDGVGKFDYLGLADPIGRTIAFYYTGRAIAGIAPLINIAQRFGPGDHVLLNLKRPFHRYMNDDAFTVQHFMVRHAVQEGLKLPPRHLVLY